MKQTKRNFFAIITACLLLFAGIFSWGAANTKTASALSPDYNGEPDTIYYFSDYYPTISYSVMCNEVFERENYSHYNIVYDHQYLDQSGLTQLIDSGYFTGFGENCVVIFDIKMNDPNALAGTLLNLRNEGCTTVFIGIYSALYYGNMPFFSYVDVFHQDDDFAELKKFEKQALDAYIGEYGNDSNFGLLLDENLVDVETHSDCTFSALCESSPFLRILVEELAAQLGINSTNYEYIKGGLTQRGIKLLVLTSSGEFVDILTWETYSPTDVLDRNNGIGCSKIAAIGFWRLSNVFYTFLEFGQTTIGIDNLPVFLLEADPFEPGDGLVCNIYTVGEEAANYVFNELEDLL